MRKNVDKNATQDKKESEIISLLMHSSYFLSKSTTGSRGQSWVLSKLMEHTTMTQKEMLEQLKIQPASLSETLTKLERKGFIIKEKDTRDRRVTVITITEAGREEYKRQALGKVTELFHGLNTEECQMLHALLRKLMDSWKKQYEFPCEGHAMPCETAVSDN